MTSAPATDAAPLCLPPMPLRRRPQQALPRGSVDCHFHVFRAGAALADPRNYTPRMVGLPEWLELAGRVGIDNGIVVQPSVYGFDNTVLLEALAAAPDRLRGIAVLPADAGTQELERLHRQGVRGARCNTRNLGGIALDAVADLAARVAPFGWVLQFQVRPEQLEALGTLAPRLGAPMVIDHLGFLDPRDRDGAVQRLRALLDIGTCYVKLSAPYRLGNARGYADFGAIAAALASSHPERLLWGSDWPHTELWDAMPDDAELVDMVADWFNDEALRRQILVDTPLTLFFSD